MNKIFLHVNDVRVSFAAEEPLKSLRPGVVEITDSSSPVERKCCAAGKRKKILIVKNAVEIFASTCCPSTMKRMDIIKKQVTSSS